MIEPTLTIDEAHRTWSAVVIGCGPAGAAAAIELSRRGVDTLLVDRKAMPRSKVCGGCVNLSALESLRSLGVEDELLRCGAHRLSRFRLFAQGRQATLEIPGGVSITRECMDAILTREAIRSGTSFLPETTVSLGETRSDHRELTFASRGRSVDVKVRVVVVAAGLGGQQLCSSDVEVRQSPGSRVGLGLVTDRVPGAVDEGSICMAVGRRGYVGLARAENGSLSVAAAVDPKLTSGESHAGACQTILDEAGIDVSLEELSGTWHGTIQLTRRPAQPASQRLLYIGDSAGYVEPFTGEGMAWALRSGRMVAPVVMSGAEEWTTDIESEWCDVYHQNVRRRQRLCRWIARGLRHPWLVSNALTACNHAPWLMRPVVRRITGEAKVG